MKPCHLPGAGREAATGWQSGGASLAQLTRLSPQPCPVNRHPGPPTSRAWSSPGGHTWTWLKNTPRPYLLLPTSWASSQPAGDSISDPTIPQTQGGNRMMASGQTHLLGVPAQFFTSCVVLVKLLSCSYRQFTHLQNEENSNHT